MAARPWTSCRFRKASVFSFVSSVPSVASRSYHGDIATTAAGTGLPSSRSRNAVLVARFPPAESPAVAMPPASNPLASNHS